MATKKISELPLITALSGSQEETLIPVVVGGLNGTTNRITAENFSKFVNAYNATTSSNTFIGAQIINGNLTVTGNQVISGRLTVNELVAQYETASIIFSSGSNKFGDELVDKQEFTGSVEITGSIIANGNLILNGASLNNSFVRIHQATGSLQNFTSSQADRNLDLSIVTGSVNRFTASQDDRNFVISQFTSSQLIVNTGLASVTASLNNFSGSTNAFTGSIEKTTASIHLATASLNYFYQSTSSLNSFTSSQADRNLNLSIVTGSVNRFTASQDDRNFVISQYTSSTDAHIVGISDFTSSQLAVNLGNSIYTASVDSHIVGISTYTSSVRDTLARIHQSTASLQQFTASQADRNLTLSTVTGSLIGITNGLMAFTAALDNTYATDAQLYQLYQATRSIELHSGSMIGVTNGLMAYTASNSTLNTGLRGEVDGIEAYTASLKGQAIVSSSTQVQNYDVFALNSNLYTSTGSLIGITNGLMAFTAALDSTYATDAQLYQLYQATRSIELHSGSMVGITNGLMAYTSSNETWKTGIRGEISGIEAWTASLDNTYATDAQLLPILQATRSLELLSGSLIGITNGLMAFTAALDSTYATDAQLYQLYAETASIKAEIGGIELYTASLKGAAIVSSSQQITNYYKFAETASANTFYGTQTFVNAETTFNYNPQTSLLASYNYLNFGGGSIMYRNATDIYIGSNAKYGSAGTVVANYTSANGMGLLTMDGAQLRYQATDVSVTAGNAYGVPIRFAINGDGNVGVNTTAPVASFLTGSLTIRKSYNNDIASVPTTTAQSYYSNQSGLYLFGRNSGISIIGGNSEECTIVYGNASTNRFASISVGTGTNAVGGDLYIKVGSDTERLRIAATGDGNVTVSTGNLVIGTSGKGIDFSATSNGSGTTSSELLNDYEEGTWSPTIRGSGTAGTYELATDYTTYTKIGRQVTLNGQIKLGTSVTGGGTGYLQILGAPFTKAADTVAAGAVVLSGINFTGDFVSISFASLGATTTIFLPETVDNTSSTDLPISAAVANAQIQFTITYFV